MFWLGNAIQTVKCNAPVKVFTVRGTAFEAAQVGGGNASIEQGSLFLSQFYKEIYLFMSFIAPDCPGNSISEWVKEELSKSDRPELTAARVVISGGMHCEIDFIYDLNSSIFTRIFSLDPLSKRMLTLT